MTDQDIRQIVEKLQYQVSILGQAIDYDSFPIQSLIMGMNWGPGDIDKAHDIFEDWDKRLENGESMNTSAFESAFEQALGVTYQGLKPIIVAFWENGQWTNVCEAYVDSFGKTPSVEYHRIARRER